jgi:hypothetical protein
MKSVKMLQRLSISSTLNYPILITVIYMVPSNDITDNINKQVSLEVGLRWLANCLGVASIKMLRSHKRWQEIENEEVIEPFVEAMESKRNELNLLEWVLKRFKDHVEKVDEKI